MRTHLLNAELHLNLQVYLQVTKATAVAHKEGLYFLFNSSHYIYYRVLIVVN